MGDELSYKPGTVCHGILNGAITPSNTLVTPAFSKACRKKWIVIVDNEYETIGDIREGNRIGELMEQHEFKYIVTQQGRYANRQGHIVVNDDSITFVDNVKHDPDWQPDEDDADTKWENDSTCAVYLPPTSNGARSPTKSPTKDRKSNVDTTINMAGYDASESAWLIINEIE